MEKPTPRINAPLREKFIGQTVRIIGKPLQLNGDTALIDSSGEIIVHLNRVSSLTRSLDRSCHRSGNLIPIKYFETSVSTLWLDVMARRYGSTLWLHDSHLHPTNAVEILGKVNEDLSVQLFTAIDFGNNIDFNTVDALVEISQKHREIFY